VTVRHNVSENTGSFIKCYPRLLPSVAVLYDERPFVIPRVLPEI